MPLLIDEHRLSAVAPSAMHTLITAARQRGIDRFGVRPLDHFFDGLGRVYCVVEAPDVDAIRRNHAEAGLELGPTREVTGLTVHRRLSRQARATIRAFLAASGDRRD